MSDKEKTELQLQLILSSLNQVEDEFKAIKENSKDIPEFEETIEALDCQISFFKGACNEKVFSINGYSQR